MADGRSIARRFGASRRGVLGAGLAGGLAAGAWAAEPPRARRFPESEMQRVLRRYHAFGDKAAGGAGDNACGVWVLEELAGAGYRCERQTLQCPGFEGEATLSVGDRRAGLVPQAIVRTTGPDGLAARLHVSGWPGGAAGAIALVPLPFRRWSTIRGEAERRVREAMDNGAAGVVLITTGPTGEATALNAPAHPPLFDRPVAILAPKDAEPFLAAAARGQRGMLRISGRAGPRTAFNVTGRLDRGAGRSLVLSTPRSGWFGCAGERGPGLAVWLALARWAAAAPLPVDVHVVCTSGHEYENEGGEHYIRSLAPPPADTSLWVHLGANVAARDWHERGPALSPLPSADPQRYLMVSPALLSAARAAFRGQPGLEQPYAADLATSAGELTNVLGAGYGPAIGVFGAHRFHHTRADDLRCVSPELAAPVAEALCDLIAGALA